MKSMLIVIFAKYLIKGCEHVKLQIHLNQNRSCWKIEAFAVRIVLEMIFKLVIFSTNDSLQIRFYVMFFTCVFFLFL